MDNSDFFAAMPANKNALIRYKTIDRCLRNRYRRWTLDDLVEACSEALYEMEGIVTGVSVRTVQADIQIMRSDKLGYNAPIEVYDGKYYRYADADYSISESPLKPEICDLLSLAVARLKDCDQVDRHEITTLLIEVREKLQHMLALG